jgi:hypothetical protein
METLSLVVWHWTPVMEVKTATSLVYLSPKRRLVCMASIASLIKRVCGGLCESGSLHEVRERVISIWTCSVLLPLTITSLWGINKHSMEILIPQMARSWKYVELLYSTVTADEVLNIYVCYMYHILYILKDLKKPKDIFLSVLTRYTNPTEPKATVNPRAWLSCLRTCEVKTGLWKLVAALISHFRAYPRCEFREVASVEERLSFSEGHSW